MTLSFEEVEEEIEIVDAADFNDNFADKSW
jgi:hypothetical protein